MEGVDEAVGLLIVDLLLDVTMEEGAGDIELVNRPTVRRHKLQHGANGGWLDHWWERLAEVDARSLVEPTNDPVRFVTLEGTIKIQLMLEDLLSDDDASS